jgi:hypothetical protein
MNKRAEFARWGLPVSLASVVWLMGCAAPNNSPQLGTAPDPVYDTAAQIQAMPPCKALVVERGPCFVHLTTADGNGFFIGSPAAGAEVVQFLGELKDGQTYNFPDTYQEYQQERARTGR